MNYKFKKFFFSAAITGTLCSFWNPSSFGMEEEQNSLPIQKKLNLKENPGKKEDRITAMSAFAHSGYKLSSLNPHDFIVWVRAAHQGCLLSLLSIGRFVSVNREEGYEWDPMIVEILKKLKKRENHTDPSLLESSVNYYLKTRKQSAGVSAFPPSIEEIDKEQPDILPASKEISTYLTYLNFLEKDEEERERLETVEKKRVEEAFAKRRADEELTEIRKSAETQLAIEITEKRITIEEELKKQVEEAKAKLAVNLKSEEEEFQRGLVLKQKAAEQEVEQYLTARKAAAEEIVQREAKEAKEKLEVNLKAEEEKLQGDIAIKRQKAEEELIKEIAAKKSAEEAELAKAIATKKIADEAQLAKDIEEKRVAAEAELAKAINEKKAAAETNLIKEGAGQPQV